MTKKKQKTDAQLTIEASNKLAKDHTSPKEAAHKFLVKLGTHRPSGGLTSRYGR